VSSTLGGFALLIGICVWLVRRARRWGRSTRAIASVVMLFGWGHMRDPRNDTVAEARDGRIDRGTHPGDPPT